MFPSEVVFALDMSNDVSQLHFERMRNILLSLLMKMETSGSNCPTGARVAIVSYNSKTDYLIRFSDYKERPALLQAVRRIPLQGSSGSRSLGEAMRFVARHVFKRVRSGLLMRKVAVFFQAGWAHDTVTINTAALELSALDITTAVITFTEEHNLPDALLVSCSGARVSTCFLPLHQGPHEEWESFSERNALEIDVYSWEGVALITDCY